MSSEDRFGFEWQKYSCIDPNYNIQFQKWIYPLTREDFQGKKILDAGCGMGRNSFWAKQWGTHGIVAFDYDERSVKAARDSCLSKYKVDYIYYGPREKKIAEVDFSQNKFLQRVYDYAGVMIYKVLK